MKHSIKIFLTIVLCITSTVSIAMELEQPQKKDLQIKTAKILTEITWIQKPLDAHFLNNNNIIVAGENGCSIIDPRDNKEIKKISRTKSACLAVHPHQTLFAIADKNTINVYNAKTYSLTYSIPVNGPSENKFQDYDIIKSITFSPHDTSILLTKTHHEYIDDNVSSISCTAEQYNHISNNNFQKSYCDCEFDRYSIIACNPIDNEICMVYEKYIRFYDSNISDVVTKGNHTKGNIRKFHHAPGGKLFAMGDFNTITIGDDKYKKRLTSFASLPTLTLQTTINSFEGLSNILFCSNSVLATLVTLCTPQGVSHSLLYYWDIHTKEIIHTDELPGIAHGFSFNPDKTKVIITLQDKVIIIPVPVEAMYKDISVLYFLFALKNINLKPETIEIPNDIIQLIASNIHEIYKRD